MNAKLLNQNYIIGFLIAFATLLQAAPVWAGDPLMDREGRAIAVQINGAATKASKPTRIVDSAGMEAYETFWTATVGRGPVCIALQPKDERLGKPEKIDVMIHEIKNEKPFQQWKNYQTTPELAQSIPAFATDKGYCISEYYLTERLRYPELPAGDYVLRVAYWGVGNWDRQDILLTVQ